MARKKETKPADNEEQKPKKKSPQRNAKGQFVKGSTKTGGRKAGTPNKYGNIRDRLKDIIMPYLDFDPTDTTAPVGSPDGKKVKSFATDLLSIDDPKDRIDAVAKILPFIVPKYSSTTITADTERPMSEEERLNELDKKYTKKEISINVKALTIVDNDAPSGDYDPDDDPNFNIDGLNK